MSVRVMTQVFGCSTATLATRLVLLALADAASDDGVTWAGQETLAEKAKVSEPTVRRCLRDLEAAGEIETRKAQRGRRRINVYRVVMPGLADVDYDRLPFTITEPFTTEQSDRSPGSDDRRSTPATTEDLRTNPVGPLSIGPVRENPEDPPTPQTLDDPPPPVLAGRQNVPLDVLLEVCSIANVATNKRAVVAAVALNGRHTPQTGKLKTPGIRHAFWDECRTQALAAPDLDAAEERLRALQGDPERFASLLADRIRTKAAQYKHRWPDVVCSPEALLKWWHDIGSSSSGLTSDEMRRS